jgi:hypothetical protein
MRNVESAFAAAAVYWDGVQDLVHMFPRRGTLDEYARARTTKAKRLTARTGATARLKPPLRK